MIKKLLAVSIIFAGLVSPHSAHAQNVNDFTIDSFNINYTLGRDSQNRSTLRTVETIQATFPDKDQNHGLERALPNTYDGHSTSLGIVSITDQSGRSLEYSTNESNGNEVVRIGNKDRYVRGQQTYVITYDQRDVTRFFKDTGRDEFYWDTNGTDWAVPISRLEVALNVDDTIRDRLSNNTACYQGQSGSSAPCRIERTDSGYRLSASNLAPGENVTLAVGFQPQTFAAYQRTAGEWFGFVWIISLIVTSIVSALLLIWLSVRYYRLQGRTKERTTIVPEYTPPKDTSVSASAAIYQAPKAVFAAQLIDLAIRGYLKLYEVRPPSFWRKAEYEIEIVQDITNLKAEEQELLNDIFATTTVGSRLALKDLKRSTAVYKKLSDNPAKLLKDIRGSYDLRAKQPDYSHWFKRLGFISLAAAVLTLSPGLAIVSLSAFISSYSLWPLTDKGLALWHYLEGLKLYIKTAEADRIKMLQSPEGAQKVGETVNPDNPVQIVKLYERVLPYVIIFGLEKDWNKQLGQYYEASNGSPEWYDSRDDVFTAAVFASSINSFSSAATYSNPASSSSGGSGGGGSSGGGGGGGGGGGW